MDHRSLGPVGGGRTVLSAEALAVLPPHGEPFLSVDPEHALVVHGKPIAPQQDVEPPVAPPRPLSRQVAELGHQLGRLLPLRLVLGARPGRSRAPGMPAARSS